MSEIEPVAEESVQSAPAQVKLLDHVNVREWQHGQRIDQVFVVRKAVRKTKQNGEPYLQLEAGDVTGTIEMVAWDDVERQEYEAPVGGLIRAYGTVEIHEKYGTRLKLGKLRTALDGEYEVARVVRGPARPVGDLEKHLEYLVGAVKHPELYDLLQKFFGHGPGLDNQFYERFRVMPAARNVHHAYRHGLLEHTVQVAQAVLLLAGSGTFEGVNVDLAVAGALLHDVGKVDCYTDGFSPEMTDAGRLHGEIALSYFRVRTAMQELFDMKTLTEFPSKLGDALLHIVSSHHGRLEWGAIVEPATREAVLVHMADKMGSTAGVFDRLEFELPVGDVWSAYDRTLHGNAWFENPMEA